MFLLMCNVDTPIVIFAITSVGITQASTPYIEEVLYTLYIPSEMPINIT